AQYVVYAPGVAGLVDVLYLGVGLLSFSVSLYLVVGCVLALARLVLSVRACLLFLGVPIAWGLHAVIVVDATIYRLFGIHVNAMVLNLAFTEGAGDSVQLGTMTWLTFSGVLTALAVFEVLLARGIFGRLVKAPSRVSAPDRRRRGWAVALALALALIAADKVSYAAADLYNVVRLTRHSRVFPVYLPVTAKRFMSRVFDFEVDREANLRLDYADSPLNYPVAPLKRERLDAYPNILMIVIDGWRFDMLDELTTPQLWDFMSRATVFDNHYSGSNASRFSVFSLLYGVNGYYWDQFLAARRSPVLIDELRNLGYQFRIVSATGLTFPEFRKTAFIRIPEDIDDRLPGRVAEERDPLVASRFLAWLDTRQPSRPFFSWLFFNAGHGPYSYTPEFERFRPSLKTPNYLTTGKRDILALKNSYKNAIMFDAAQVGTVLTYLEAHHLLDHTIVLITADHGEEFYEHGRLGHTSGFSKYQTKVPLILHVPGRPPLRVGRLTSHVDVVPTLLAELGYTSPPSSYSQGRSLFTTVARDSVVSCGWGECAIIDQPNTIVFSTELHGSSFFEIRNRDYQLASDPATVLSRNAGAIRDLMAGFRQFRAVQAKSSTSPK
ncbi:MAG: sulfatase-like hydrolase/transferase, partial [Chloroflexi bacterium]|nr:sulfatase-like hydrolase/transferase [Chloroflexota bacterium]